MRHDKAPLNLTPPKECFVDGSRAVFLDRDGTINVEKNYLWKIEDWEWIPGAPEAIRELNDTGFRVIVVSNQAGIAKGYYKAEDVIALHHFVSDALARIGARIDAYYFCPHHPDFGDAECTCRKPKPGMLLRAAADYKVDLQESWIIGDKLIDVTAGKRAGTKAAMVKTGYGAKESLDVSGDIPVFESVLSAAKYISRTSHTLNCSNM